MAEPALSVVIPVYDRAEIVGHAVRSVASSVRAAGVARGRVELIVVDDGSADASAAAAEAAGRAAADALEVKVLRQPNAGAAAARNRGVAASRAAHVAFLDSDDIWFDWTVRTCLDAVEAFPDAALFFLRPCVFTAGGRPRPVRSPGLRFEPHDGFIAAATAESSRSFGTNNVILRRSVFDRLGGFSADFRCMEDTDLFLRADSEGRCIVMAGEDHLGLLRGGRDDNLTGDWACVSDGFGRMMRRESAGDYPGGRRGDPRRDRLLASNAVTVARLGFATGRPARAYGVYLRNLPLILRRRTHWALRLPLTPLLALLRPRSYRFRLRPAR